MSDNELPFEIDCPAVKTLLDSDESFLLLDVRTLAEHGMVHLEGATLIPIQEIAERKAELDSHRQDRVVVYCHHGGRSEQVATWLRQQGFDKAQNMTGGIDAWAVQVDQTIVRY